MEPTQSHGKGLLGEKDRGGDEQEGKRERVGMEVL